MWYVVLSLFLCSQFCPRQSLPPGHPSLLHIHNNAHLQLPICAHHQFSSSMQNICTGCCFVVLKKPQVPPFRLPHACVFVSTFNPTTLGCCAPDTSPSDHCGFDLTEWLLSRVGHSWAHHFPGGCSWSLTPSLATRVQFSIPEILPLYLFHPHFCL